MKFLALSAVFALAVASVAPEDVPTTAVSSNSTATTLTSVLRPAPTAGAAVMNSTVAAKFREMSPDFLALLTGEKLPDGATILDSTPVGEVPEPLKSILNHLPGFLKKLFEFYVFKAEHGDADSRHFVVGTIDAIQGVKSTAGNLLKQIVGTVKDTTSEATSLFQQVHDTAAGVGSTPSVETTN